MACYYFHVRDHKELLDDPEGREVELSEVPALALAEARALISAEAREGRINFAQRIEVEDEQGKIVHRLAFADAVTIVAPVLTK